MRRHAVRSNSLKRFSDERLTTELRERGFHVYPRVRVQILQHTVLRPSVEWDWRTKNDQEYRPHIERRIAEALGDYAMRQGCVAFRDYSLGSTEMRAMEGSAGFIMPKKDDAHG